MIVPELTSKFPEIVIFVSSFALVTAPFVISDTVTEFAAKSSAAITYTPILAEFTALSAIFAVVTALSATFAVVTASSCIPSVLILEIGILVYPVSFY